MDAREKKRIRDNLKYNKFRGVKEAREYLKFEAMKRENNLPSIKDLVEKILKKEG